MATPDRDPERSRLAQLFSAVAMVLAERGSADELRKACAETLNTLSGTPEATPDEFLRAMNELGGTWREMARRKAGSEPIAVIWLEQCAAQLFRAVEAESQRRRAVPR